MNLLLTDFHFLGADFNQPGGLLANQLHLLLAHICGDDELPSIFLALPPHSNGKVHFSHFSGDAARQRTQLGQLLFVRGEQDSQAVQVLPCFIDSRVIRLQVPRVARQQISALPGFSVQHVLKQFINCGA